MKYALITGGTNGIGFELARNFARDGYGVIIVSSSNERLQKAKREIEGEFTSTVLTYQQNWSVTTTRDEIMTRKLCTLCLKCMVWCPYTTEYIK